MKGTREKMGKNPVKLTVKWAADVYDPVPNSACARVPSKSRESNHKCTDPESCKHQMTEDFEHEKPLWKLTCYGHSKSGPCDIVDVSYEELPAAAYDDDIVDVSYEELPAAAYDDETWLKLAINCKKMGKTTEFHFPISY